MVPPSQSPSVVPLLNSLQKHISSNKILFCFDEMFEFLIANLQNWQLLKWWHSASYWINEILCFLQRLWIMVKGQEITTLKIITWINYLPNYGVSFGFYTSHHKSSCINGQVLLVICNLYKVLKHRRLNNLSKHAFS